MDTEQSGIVKLRSMADEDGKTEVFELPYEAAMISDLVRDALAADEDDDDDDDDEEPSTREVEVLRVKGPCLAKVVDFMKHDQVARHAWSNA